MFRNSDIVLGEQTIFIINI